MPGSTQGKARPDIRASTTPTSRGVFADPPRERISFSDAECVTERVRTRINDIGLRGARKAVMSAVLVLLCERWTKVTDTRLRLSQVITEIVDAGGRRYDPKTIGRALAGLAADDLITYRAAQGRGGFAEIAIHRQFLTDITVLQRDESGRVITESVTFSGALPYSYPKGLPHYSPNSRSPKQSHRTRPTEVDVRSDELRSVLANLPAPMATLPRHLRWMLGKEIKGKLARGFRPDQILAVLSAPMPDTVERPWRLARHRLKMNMTGSGPRLRPLQAAWDRTEAERNRAAAKDAQTSWYEQVYAVTNPADRQRILTAHTAKFGSVRDPSAAIGQAGRRAVGLYPKLDLHSALLRWCTDMLGQARSQTLTPKPASMAPASDLLSDLVSGGCIQCGTHHADVRQELPLPLPVCDSCWPGVQAELHAAENADELAAVA